MRTVILLLLAIVLGGCGSATVTSSTTASGSAPSQQPTVSATSPPGENAEVVQVFDGDSLIVAIDGTEYEIRLLGINAPEGDECHGDAARQTLEQLLGSGRLTLVADREDADQYGRLLRYLYVDGLNVNLALVANGDAVALQVDHILDPEFTSVADAAAGEGLGMWAADACGSAGPLPSIEIADYVYDPRGRDEDNLNGEWVAVVNTGPAATNLSGWIVRDESTQHRFHFPDGYVLDAGNEILIHSGCGEDTATDLYWCANGPVWSNGGDTAILQDAAGTVVDSDRFSGDY